MEIKIEFQGKNAVSAHFDGFKVLTDQPIDSGGEGLAPAPFDLFLASIGTCAGFFIRSFCSKRAISTDGIRLREIAVFEEETHRLKEVKLEIDLPGSFPVKYKDALISAVNLCSVKKAMMSPPEFNISTRIAPELKASP